MWPYRVVYVAGVTYPNAAANALQTVHMAAALANHTRSTDLFVRDMVQPKQIYREYGIEKSSLQLRSLYMERWPRGRSRYGLYNRLVAAFLQLHPRWWRGPRVLMVRHPWETWFWGKQHRRYFKDWTFIFDAHSMYFAPQESDPDYEAQAQKARRMLQSYDIVLSLTDELTGDIRAFTGGTANAVTVPLCSGLPRLPAPPVIQWPPDQVTIGYIGTVDRLRGLDVVLPALALLPDHVKLRIVGRIRSEGDEPLRDGIPVWLADLLSVPEIARKTTLHPALPYAQISQEIDACDLVIQPAGQNTHAARYANPLKLFDYMVRGKPIIAADVSSHRGLLEENVNAVFYRPGAPDDLAARITALISQPQLIQTIAAGAWKLSEQFTYDARAQRILDLVDQVRSPA